MYLNEENKKILLRIIRYILYLFGFLAFLILIVVVVDQSLLFPSDWMMKGRVMNEYRSDKFYEFIDGIFLYFKDEPLTILEKGDMRKSYFSLIVFVVSLIFFIIPLGRAIFKLLIPIFSSLTQAYNLRYKVWFHRGAEVIDKGSKWALLITLIFYLAYDREQKKIENSWNTIIRFEGKYGDLGRKESLESLIEYGVDLVDINLSNATLKKADFSARSKLFREPVMPNFILANFSNANLRQASFECSIARNTNFSGALLQEANFRAVDLRQANFQGAEFGATWGFSFTDFSFSDLRDADLSDKQISQDTVLDLYNKYSNQEIKSGAWLYNADIRGAKLGKRIIGLDDKLMDEFKGSALGDVPFAYINVLTSKWDSTTVFPDTIDSYLIKLGIRDGNINKDRKLFREAEKAIHIMYKKFMKKNISDELHKLDVSQRANDLVRSYISSQDKENSSHVPSLCEAFK